jgi:hypothetical protein
LCRNKNITTAKYNRLKKEKQLIIGRGGENIYKMFSYHHPIVSTPGLTHRGTGQGSGEIPKRKWGKGNPEAAIVIKSPNKIG